MPSFYFSLFYCLTKAKLVWVWRNHLICRTSPSSAFSPCSECGIFHAVFQTSCLWLGHLLLHGGSLICTPVSPQTLSSPLRKNFDVKSMPQSVGSISGRKAFHSREEYGLAQAYFETFKRNNHHTL